MDITKKDLLMLWDALDTDGGGELEIEEFIHGLRKLKGEAKAKDILKLYREVRSLEDAVHMIDSVHPKFMKEMDEITKKVRRNFKHLDATRRTLNRLKEMARLAAKSQPLSSFDHRQNEDDEEE